MPLARAGEHVTAVDFHARLLAELRAAAPSVETHEADLVEAVGADHVSVTDILTTAEPAGLRTRIGSYPKLRLAPADVAASAAAAGLAAERTATEAGLLLQLFRAPT